MPLAVLTYGILADARSVKGTPIGRVVIKMMQSDGKPFYLSRDFEVIDAEVTDHRLLEMRAKTHIPQLGAMLMDVLLKGGYRNETDGARMIPGFRTFKMDEV